MSDFDFDLPEGLIALRPARPRHSARMLVAAGAATHDARAIDLPRFLRAGDVLVFNDTRVIPARLSGIRRRATTDGSGEAKIEATLAIPEGRGRWQALLRPAKRLRAGDAIHFGAEEALTATLADDPQEGLAPLVFDREGQALEAAIAAAGAMPLPPYIAGRRAADAQDREDYQTVFARQAGSVAALADPILERWFSKPFRESDEIIAWRNMLIRQPAEGYIGCCAAIAETDLFESTVE
ncbi:MAG: S-adenosylmethionine:tRNA ribosyltransferase-isomerase, partial [Pseudomonadota bacterium]